MANGSHWRSKEEWQRVEAPLQQLDSVLAEFAEQFDLRVSWNHKDWPERSIVWGEDIRLLMQVYLASQEKLTFNMWLCASQDRDGKRFWKHETLVEDKAVPQFAVSFASLLREGKAKLESWSKRELEFATNVAAVPPGT